MRMLTRTERRSGRENSPCCVSCGASPLPVLVILDNNRTFGLRRRDSRLDIYASVLGDLKTGMVEHAAKQIRPNVRLSGIVIRVIACCRVAHALLIVVTVK